MKEARMHPPELHIPTFPEYEHPPNTPIPLLIRWIEEAEARGIENAGAMVLATVDGEG
jgi:pyridoxine/pyridoxamine 5'-phosphate oxidase